MAQIHVVQAKVQAFSRYYNKKGRDIEQKIPPDIKGRNFIRIPLTCRPCYHDAPVDGAVRVLEPAVLVEAADDEADVDEGEEGGEGEELRVVPHVGH